MKTQISNLRSGTKNQILNNNVDYTLLPSASSHNGHCGTNRKTVDDVWSKILAENPNTMNVIIKGINLEMKRSDSLSGKSSTFTASISKDQLENVFGLVSAKNEEPSISIHCGNIITVSNGKNSYKTICPSLVTIL